MKHSVIVRHSLIVLLIWVIIAALSAPLAQRIDEVTNYNAERLLPNGTDSVKANELLSEILESQNGTVGGATSLSYDIVIVTGVDTNDPRLLEWDKDLNKSLDGLVEQYSSPYQLVNEILSNAEPMLENMSSEMFNGTTMFLDNVRPLYDNRDTIIEFINTTHRILIILDEAGDTIYLEMPEIRDNTSMIYGNLTMFKEYYANISQAYNASIMGLEGARGLTILIYNMLIVGDQYYSSSLENLDSLYNNVTMTNMTVKLLAQTYYDVSRTYTMRVYDVARIHYYLSSYTTAYQTGLNQTIIDEVVNYTSLSGYPVTPSLVNQTYLLIVSSYDPANITVQDIFKIATTIYMANLTSLPYELQQLYMAYLPFYNNTLLTATTQYMAGSNITGFNDILGAGPVEGQITLYSILQGLREECLPISVDYYAEEMAPLYVTMIGLPENATPVIVKLFKDALLPGYPVNVSVLRSVVINDTMEFMEALTGMEPMNSTYVLISEVYDYGPVPKAAQDSLRVFLEEIFHPPEFALYAVYSTIIQVDPAGTGILYSNKTLAEDLSFKIVSNATTLPEPIIREAYYNESRIPYLAYIMLREMIVNMTGEPELGVIADIVYKYNGRVCYEGYSEIMSMMLSEFMPVNVTGVDKETIMIVFQPIIRDAWYGNLSETYLLKLFVSMRIMEEIMPVFEEMMPSGTMGNEPVNMTIDFNALMTLPMVESLVDGSYDPENDTVIIDTFTQMMELFPMPTSNMTCMSGFEFSEEFIRDLAEKLIGLQENPSRLDLAEAFAGLVIDEMLSSFSADEIPMNTNIFEEIIVDILAHSKDPLDCYLDHLEDMMPSEARDMVDIDVLKNAIGRAVEENDSQVIFEALYDEMKSDVFSNITSTMEGLMISPEHDAFIIVFNPVSEPDTYENALKVRDIVKETLVDYGYSPSYVGVTGDDVLMKEAREANSRDIENVNRISILAPIIIALILIGGFIAAGLPFTGIGLSVLSSTAILYILGSLGVIDVTSWARMLMITTSFGLGMDYSSYIVLRFKEKIAEFRDPKMAAHDALMHSLPAIAAASSTDIIGFAVMMLAWDFPLLASIGQMVPIAILTVLASSLTFTPALLARFGDRKWFWWPHDPLSGRGKWRGFTLNKARALGLVALALVLAGIGANGLLSFKGSHDYSVFMPEGTEGYKAYMKLQEEFPAGQLMPVYIVCRIDHGSVWYRDVMDHIKQMASDIESIDGVVQVDGPHNPGNKPKEAYVSSDNKTFFLEVVIKPSPMSREGIDLVKIIRNKAYEYRGKAFSEVYIGGLSAASLEMEELLVRDFWGKIFPAGIVLMWLAMSISFTSVWAGIISLSTIVIGYMLGITLASKIPAMYGQPALWFLPLMTFPAVLGVGMDYNSFYMNRQREELEKAYGRKDAGYRAASIAIRSVSHLVIGLGLIVTSTYMALVIGSSWGVRELGLALAGGVFTTTLLAALVFTPAILALMGEKAWWPYSRRWKKNGSD